MNNDRVFVCTFMYDYRDHPESNRSVIRVLANDIEEAIKKARKHQTKQKSSYPVLMSVVQESVVVA